MKTTDILISDFTDPKFQNAFQIYFAELGIQVKNWDGLFAEMNEGGANRAWLRLSESGDVIGFIQFIPIAFSSWFFEETRGFIREFWIREDYRHQGHGTALLDLAEHYLADQGIRTLILTTDTAPDFYRRRGYEQDGAITAKNKDDVFTKRIR